MFRKILTLAAVPAAVAAMALPASAATHPSITAPISHTIVYTGNGEAGYYAFSGTHFARVQAKIGATVAAEGLGANGGEGIGLCNANSGRAVQEGLVWNAGENAFDVQYGAGDLSSCTTGGALTGTDVGLTVPAGDKVSLSITDEGHGLMEIRATDLTVDTSTAKVFVHCLTFPDVASAGVVQNQAGLSAPASIELGHFSDTRVFLPSGKNGDFGRGHSRWTAVQVVSTANGTSSDPALVTPASSLDAGHFDITIGAETGV